MLTKSVHLLLLPSLVLSLATVFFSAPTAQAAEPLGLISAEAPCQSKDPKEIARCGIESSNPNAEDAEEKVNSVLKTVLEIITWVGGFIVVIVFLISSISLALSGGSSESVGRARNALIYALIGGILLSIGRILIIYVLDRV